MKRAGEEHTIAMSAGVCQVHRPAKKSSRRKRQCVTGNGCKSW